MSDNYHERYLKAVKVDPKDNNHRLGALLSLWAEDHSLYWREAERYYGGRA